MPRATRRSVTSSFGLSGARRPRISRLWSDSRLEAGVHLAEAQLRRYAHIQQPLEVGAVISRPHTIWQDGPWYDFVRMVRADGWPALGLMGHIHRLQPIQRPAVQRPSEPRVVVLAKVSQRIDIEANPGAANRQAARQTSAVLKSYHSRSIGSVPTQSVRAEMPEIFFVRCCQ